MRQYRTDSVPVPDSLRQYVTAEDAHKHLIGQQSGAEQARLRMLQRMGLDRENGPGFAVLWTVRWTIHRTVHRIVPWKICGKSAYNRNHTVTVT